MARFAEFLSDTLGRTVVDRTGFTDAFDVHLQFVPGQMIDDPIMRGQVAQPTGGDTGSDSGGPSIVTALQEQLGLKLGSERGPVEVLVIDNVERPTPN